MIQTARSQSYKKTTVVTSTTRCPSNNYNQYRLAREHLKQFFREHDINGDGRLSINELSKAFGSLGAFFPVYRAYAGRFVADSDGDGYIDEAELDKLVAYAERCNFNLIDPC